MRNLLMRSEPDDNIFSNKIKPYNNDYFKMLFRRFKQLNPKVDKDHSTLLGTQES
jgi:hypothetical protein